METIVTISRCHPLAYGLVAGRRVTGVEVVSPRPPEQRGVDSLVDIDISVARTVPIRDVLAWIFAVLAQCGPNAKLRMDGKDLPAEEMALARRLDSKRRDDPNR